MADYQLTATDMILRTVDNVWIPPDPANRYYAEYLQWVEAGGVPDPYAPPEPAPPQPSTGQTVLYEHENRIRVLEGAPPLTLGDFITKVESGSR